MNEIRLSSSPRKILKTIALSIPFVIFGIWSVCKDLSSIVGWSSLCFFGLGAFIIASRLFYRTPQIIINKFGIWDRSINQNVIWEQIVGAYPIQIYGQAFISLVVDATFQHNQKPYRWATLINQTVGAQNLNLSIGQLNIDVNLLTGFINEMAEAKIEEREKLIQELKMNHFLPRGNLDNKGLCAQQSHCPK